MKRPTYLVQRPAPSPFPQTPPATPKLDQATLDRCASQAEGLFGLSTNPDLKMAGEWIAKAIRMLPDLEKRDPAFFWATGEEKERMRSELRAAHAAANPSAPAAPLPEGFMDLFSRSKRAAPPPATQPIATVGEPDRYDLGLLGDGGGGDVDWWQDYLRAELERAHEFYSDQFATLRTPPPVATATVVDADQSRDDYCPGYCARGEPHNGPHDPVVLHRQSGGQVAEALLTPPQMTEAQALELYRRHCQPGDRGTLERYGERAAVAAILSLATPTPPAGGQ